MRINTFVSKDKKPNIVFLMDDQHRHDALGLRNPLVVTPCLDRLAKEGILFDNAFCNAPMCVPSRYSMMTGLYPSQCGVRNNGQMCPSDASLPWDVIPQRLKQLGYRTGGDDKGFTDAPGRSVGKIPNPTGIMISDTKEL